MCLYWELLLEMNQPLSRSGLQKIFTCRQVHRYGTNRSDMQEVIRPTRYVTVSFIQGLFHLLHLFSVSQKISRLRPTRLNRHINVGGCKFTSLEHLEGEGSANGLHIFPRGVAPCGVGFRTNELSE